MTNVNLVAVYDIHKGLQDRLWYQNWRSEAGVTAQSRWKKDFLWLEMKGLHLHNIYTVSWYGRMFGWICNLKSFLIFSMSVFLTWCISSWSINYTKGPFTQQCKCIRHILHRVRVCSNLVGSRKNPRVTS